MPRPRRKIDRWRQIFRYLRHRFPAPFETKLVFENQEPGNFAEAYELEVSGPRVVYVSIDPRRTLLDGNQDLLHEYAHAMTWPVSKRQLEESLDHPPQFWAAYGVVYVDFVDETGGKDSEDY